MTLRLVRTLLGEIQGLIVAVSLGIMVLVAVLSTALGSRTMLADLRAQATTTANDLAALLEYPLYNVDHQAALGVAQTYLSSGKISGIILESSAGGVLLDRRQGGSQSKIPPITKTIEGQGLPLGSFTVTFSDASVRDGQRLCVILALAICLSVLFANLVVSRLVGRRVQKPFLEIFQAMETMAAGQFTRDDLWRRIWLAVEANALDTVLVHRAIAQGFLPRVVEHLAPDGVTFRAEPLAASMLNHETVLPAGEKDFDTEWLSLVLGLKVVDGLDEAIEHIAAHSTAHSDGILTREDANAQRFIAEVDSAAVYVNASTRFTDGGQFGLGAEVAISTQPLHARGPMGLRELTTYKWVVFGNGQVRP